MVMRVMMPVSVGVDEVDVDVVRLVLVVVVVGRGDQRWVEEEEVVGQGSGLVRKSISQPW